MPKIDISSWGEFKLIDLFELCLSKGDNQAQKLDLGDTPLISSGSFNNGICKYIDKCDGVADIFEGNSITIDMFGQPFFQKHSFYAVSHGRVNILKPYFKMNEYIGLFFVSVLLKSVYPKYGFTTMCSQTALKKEVVLLPVTEDGKPDWQYMEDYMRTIEARVSDSLSKLESAKEVENSKIDIGSWGEFLIGNLFDTTRGKVKNLQTLEKGNIPVIAAARANQGVAGLYNVSGTYVNKITISCNGVGCGSTFYHPYSFNVGSDAIVLTELKPMTDKVKQFITCMLDSLLTRKYSYEEKCSADKLKVENFYLPIDSKGEPDWLYMENYIKAIETKVNDFLDKTA